MAIATKRGISQKSFVVVNALPPVEDSVVLEKAGLVQSEPATRLPFKKLWRYSSGDERETLDLAPGVECVLRESDARMLFAEMNEEGIAIYELGADAETIGKAKREAMRRAWAFYRDRGSKKITHYRKLHGMDEKQAEDERYGLLWINHYNQACADIIQEALGTAVAEGKRKPGRI